jgi:hypothetical protein
MTVPQVDIFGKRFTERDKKLLELLLRPNGATKYELNRATMKRVAAHSFKNDSDRLAKRVGGTAWRDPPGKGDTRRFGIKLTATNSKLGSGGSIASNTAKVTVSKQPQAPYRKTLGDWGEDHACRLLTNAKFTDVEPLNVDRQQPGGDVLATKDGLRYFFSVKARDRFGQDGKPNPGYNIYPEKVRKAALPFGATPAWLVIRADRRDNTFCSYWGLVDEIPPGRAGPNRVYVSMSEEAISGYCRLGRCLASNAVDSTISTVFSGKLY